ncbi:MAG: single-stranded DNA-binding protein [Spirochaetes bacterium]|nr:single-stranded DNA-binding protein [Spirochaetota bacterium]
MASTDLNRVMLIGRLTADPKIDQLPTGTQKASFSIANNYYSPNKQNEANFFDLVAFGKLAEICGTYLKKGKQVAVIGSLRQQRWQDKTTGANRSRVEVIVNDMQMLGARTDGGDNAPAGSMNDAPPASAGETAPPPQAGGFDDDEVPF